MYSYCQKKLYSDGYKIYTSIDLTMQQQLQDSIDLTLLDFTDTTDDGTFKLQRAATCIDNDNGLCDRKGILIHEGDTCDKHKEDWREKMLSKFDRRE